MKCPCTDQAAVCLAYAQRVEWMKHEALARTHRLPLSERAASSPRPDCLACARAESAPHP